MQDVFITCRSCGRDIPKTLYCIYCGAALSKGEIAPKPEPVEKRPTEEEVEPVESKSIPEIVDEAFFQIPSPGLDVQVEPPSVTDVELDPETVNLMDELRKYHIWKVKLCGLLVEDGVSEEVFTRIYEEYVNKINEISKIRDEKIANYRKQHGEKRDELKEIKQKHEELRARVAVGQISSSDLLIQTPELMESISSLTIEISKLEDKLSKLNNLMRGMPPKEIFELEKTARKGIESLDSLINGGKISDELGDKLHEDLKAVMTMLDGAVSDWKGEEKELRSEFETLEVRYKIGEITISEFESQKQRIIARLEQLWA